ncbi:DNA segregation ATPase FtsK/SpoIIIE, S-DNA-T family [Nocardioides scoriae]|uniref:DNA segregation ATPase FtsK/SpoIIIE, S-DNA-T family n=1 Tax=Nocardioides scoriae TaxID=642780 RepID=A0A1H1LM38_9ACTN|nr:FtsK/SpoIIIE domain-containing protein [Nocardioides scoriae]SDR75634.1 DNA segregation ATPase FtsK/SpoIIIE, S-DNA-T family [Nocardioides scoriae]
MTLSKTAATAWSETRFWVNLLAWLSKRHPGHVVVALALVWLAWGSAPTAIAVAGAFMVVARSWMLLRPGSYWRLAGPIVGRYRAQIARLEWVDALASCGLANERPALRVVSRWPRLVLRTRLAGGQTIAGFEQQAEALRSCFGASQIRVEPDGTRDVRISLAFEDVLGEPFAATVPRRVRGASVVIGREWNGSDWALPIGPHTLVAGCSGSGKGAVLWSFVFGLAPAVRDSRIQLHGIDLKGGMEILMGRGLFTTVATSQAEAVALLELLVQWLQRRTRQYAGHVRSHEPTTDDPLHVIVIDELAALTAYSIDRELQRRADVALNILLSQGRAPGFVVFACLQDPRKDVVPARGLFTQMVGLRLKDSSESTMVLGEAAVQAGAHCHRLSVDVPGTGYVVPEAGGPPVKVRAGYASDELIRETATMFATPTTLSVLPVRPEHQRRGRRADRASDNV